MSRLVERFLLLGKGLPAFFLVGLVKFAVIGGGFFLASLISVTAVFIYILGVLTIVAALVTDAVRQYCRSGTKHGT